jgi:cytochrome c oxidase cbb3-type subunit 3
MNAPAGARRSAISGGPTENPYHDNAYAMTEGQRLYEWFNCSGCHSRGGGGIGPPLMADDWRYGKNPGDIYSSIVDGRPNGMPSWRGRMTEFEAWQIVTYVQALRGDRGIAAPPGPRGEHMQAGEGSVSR